MILKVKTVVEQQEKLQKLLVNLIVVRMVILRYRLVMVEH